MCGDEYAEALDSAWRRACKEHRCCACRETIRRGDRYHHESSVYDCRVSAYKHCARCWTMLVAISRETDEPVDYHLNCGERWEDPPDEVARLAFLTRDDAQGLVP